MDVQELKNRIFGLENIVESGSGYVPKTIDTGRFSLEEVLEFIARQEQNPVIIKNPDKGLTPKDLDESFFFEGEEIPKPRFIFYEVVSGVYYTYSREQRNKAKKIKEPKHQNLYVPTGVIVRRVPSHILGTGVLGRAFLHQNYIEILESLMGNNYIEVLTHELLHLEHSHYGEMKIRMMTRNYVVNARYQ